MGSSGNKASAYAGAGGMVLVTVGLAYLLHRVMPHANLSLLFLTGVLVVAARSGLGPSLLASVLSFLAFNYFFTRPYYTLQVADDGDVATLAFLLVFGALTGNLAARMYREISMRQHSLKRTSELYDFSRKMSSAAGTEAVPAALAQHLHKSLSRGVWVLLSESGKVPTARTQAGDPPELAPDDIEVAWSSRAPEPVRIAPWTFSC
jgi:two-component system sensor histidine kinase KdpD